ncbi:flavin reductase (DIM6/NTAB) family NADH-FMN oxidoreductase RutF [Scopulibacillus darangshiensis]|uniref:Flavin reductase (DIM6/NTAB) family NADH-FMN oxidoreductase RutF n=1 Tax=Scopulibacillus darangshiensis TaxID=442528 RepID=A0A4R2NTR7_9BACL|nr:flavin reductase family protein [Scopulibacillus darangshiensis]TCP24951.1 flavin reductase (DIM6/NTAB) family NADH-FMN oxidoreductase RutF [Scopulibacillus darangshiensis]
MMTKVDGHALRNACGKFLTGVTVVTAQGKDGNQVGFTANSFSSVSLEPPMVLICVGKNITSYDQILSADGFAVHVLSVDQKDLSTHFAKKGGDKFKDLVKATGLYAAPILSDCSAVFECRTANQIDAGDHTILLGEVEQLTSQEPAKEPLGFFQGKYTSIGIEA